MLYKLDNLPFDSDIKIYCPDGSDNSNLYKITMEGNQFPDVELVNTPEGKQLQILGDWEFLDLMEAFCRLAKQKKDNG